MMLRKQNNQVEQISKKYPMDYDQVDDRLKLIRQQSSSLFGLMVLSLLVSMMVVLVASPSEALGTINIWKHRYPFHGGYYPFYGGYGGYGGGYGGISLGGGYGRR